ncbi:MAG: GH3 auxin-responsive promoter family protein [Bacteroidales bacterium]|nr:GH3 auxin-responsive promoter family protein [Bacteroidales bacterium]
MRVDNEKKPGFIINAILWLIGRPELRHLRDASLFPRATQARTLRSILEKAKDSEFGVEHHFAEILAAGSDSKMFELYRKYLKPSEFEDYRPYVEKMMNGAENILFEGKPVLYATTSGSTGDPKYVPISKIYMENVYGRMTRLWLYNFTRYRRKTFVGKIFAVVGKCEEGRSPDGTVYGSVSGFTQADAPQMIKNMYAVPSRAYDIDDYEARNYTLMRIAIEHNITLWIAPNPSTVLELQNNVDRWLDEFIEDIGNGTLSRNVAVPDAIRKDIEPLLKPNPERAYQLRALQSQYDRVLPRHYWPNLQLLSTWKCGNTQIYLKKMNDFLPEKTFHAELGYFSTECRFGLDLEAGIDTILMPHMHFYEFKREKDLGDPDAPFYLLAELKEGERYCPFVTTYSGLYRYNMNDIVQAGPAYYNTPRVHMIQKVNGIVSITGEKLYEDQFIKAVDMAQESTGMKLSYYTGYVNLQESRYDWYFEFSNMLVKQKQAEAFARVVDENLKKLNIEYASKRDSFRLKDPAIYLLQVNAFDKFKEFILNRNHRDASRFKPNVLAQNESNHKVIHSLRQRIQEKLRPSKGKK